MQSSTKWIIGALVALGLSAVAAGWGVVALFVPVRSDTDSGDRGPTVVTEGSEAPIVDGDWFGLVTVGGDETGRLTLGVDLAEMLSGPAAHEAAVEAGVITSADELPNDYFVYNPESTLELIHLAGQAKITVLSGKDPGTGIVVNGEELLALYEGSYVGPPIYGIVAHQPIAMDLVVRDGLVASAAAVYLP